MQPSNTDEETALLQSYVKVEENNPSNLKIATAAIASALLLGVAYVTSQHVSSTVVTNPTDLASVFGGVYTRYTHKNWDGDLVYLDRHNMDQCGSDPMAGFKMVDRIQFMYKCNSVHAPRTHSYTDNTNPNSRGGIQFLDRHHAYCRNGYVMSQLQGATNGDRFYWKFTCSQYDFDAFSCPTEKNTGFNENGPGHTMIFLDRHDVSCPSGEALQGILQVL